MDGKYSCLFQNLSRTSVPVDSGDDMNPQTASGDMPAASMISAMVSRPP